jgi:hypothetical protein
MLTSRIIHAIDVVPPGVKAVQNDTFSSDVRYTPPDSAGYIRYDED